MIEIDATETAADAARARWLTGSRLPTECEPVFRWGRAHGIIDADLIAQRVELLLGNGQPGFARVIARQLPEDRAERYNRWAALLEEPAGGFDALIAAPETSPGVDAVLDAWSRFARNAPTAAAITRVRTASLLSKFGSGICPLKYSKPS